VRLLLDENFPLALERRMLEEGFDVEHVITLGRRGMLDRELFARLRGEPHLVLLTQDTEFLDPPPGVVGKIVVSRVSQGRPLRERVAVWAESLGRFLRDPPPQLVFELDDGGDLVPWTIVGA
jgi:hypothetical protein